MKGLYDKYIITKVDGTPVEGFHFILKPESDPVAFDALAYYAKWTHNNQLAVDLWYKLGSIRIEKIRIEKMRLSVEQVQVAVAWWVGVLKESKGESVQQFQDALTQYLLEHGAPDGIHTDYQPCSFLGDIAEAAGLSELAFPIKTSMWFHDHGVQVGHGHGAPIETLYFRESEKECIEEGK